MAKRRAEVAQCEHSGYDFALSTHRRRTFFDGMLTKPVLRSNASAACLGTLQSNDAIVVAFEAVFARLPMPPDTAGTCEKSISRL